MWKPIIVFLIATISSPLFAAGVTFYDQDFGPLDNLPGFINKAAGI